MEHGINLFRRELVGVKHIIELKEETEKLQNTVNLQLNDNNNIIPVFRLSKPVSILQKSKWKLFNKYQVHLFSDLIIAQNMFRKTNVL